MQRILWTDKKKKKKLFSEMFLKTSLNYKKKTFKLSWTEVTELGNERKSQEKRKRQRPR